MDHGTFRELAAGAALDDLDATERESLHAHLGTCPACRDEARRLADAAGMLAFAAPRRTPPPSLQGSVLAAVAASENRPVGVPAASLTYAAAAPVRSTGIELKGSAPAPGDVSRAVVWEMPAEAGAGSAAGSVAELEALRRDRTRYRRLSFAGLAAAAILAIAVGALGASAAGLRTDLQATAAERDAAVAELAAAGGAMSVALAPGHATATMKPDPIAAQATVYVVYLPGTPEAWMMAGNLPATPAGKVYQLWSADAAGVHPLTTFTCDGSHACLASYGVDLATSTATMITLEPAGGSQGEPGPQVAFGTLEG